MFESLAGQLEAAGSACEAVAGTLEAWNAGSGQGYGQLATEAEASALGDAEGAILDRRLEEAMERIAASAQRCPDHPRLAAAFEQFDRVVDFE